LPHAPTSQGELEFAGTAFLTLAGQPKSELQQQIEQLSMGKEETGDESIE
jgi:hypothetical protein